jgi:hypothetical protein
MENNTSLYKLVTPSFSMEYGGKTFQVKKANLEMAVKYQIKAKELDGKDFAEITLTAYAIFLVLNKADNSVTEEWVNEEFPADIDILECLMSLGFISPKGLEIARKVRIAIIEKQTGDKSS